MKIILRVILVIILGFFYYIIFYSKNQAVLVLGQQILIARLAVMENIALQIQKQLLLNVYVNRIIMKWEAFAYLAIKLGSFLYLLFIYYFYYLNKGIINSKFLEIFSFKLSLQWGIKQLMHSMQ